MAVMMILDVQGGTVEQYEKVNEILGVTDDSDAPAGLISHACAVTDGGILIADLWDSQESLDHFLHAGLGAAIAESGMPEAEPRILSVHHTIRGNG